MERAVVAIGVKRTGGLPELQAAVEGAGQFAAWARESQRIPDDRVILITDAAGKVTRDQIFDSIEAVTKLGFIEQLIVYFSGHGINSNRSEKWLLSRAPDDPQAAVNVAGSEVLARFSGIRHVVFVSDACRTAADSIQAQGVTGGEIFPNLPPAGSENPVDQYFATLVGHPAYEVKDVQASARRYRAAYTTVLLSALGGSDPSIAEDDAEGRLIRPRALKKYLRTAVPAYLGTLNLSLEVNQEPDARIESDDDAWIARLDVQGAPPARSALRSRTRKSPPRAKGAAPGAPTIVSEAQSQLQSALGAPAPAPRRRTRAARASVAPAPSLFEAAMGNRATPFGPDHFESQCGIKVRGARIAAATVQYGQAVVGRKRDVVRVDLPGDRRAVNVIVEFEDGTGVMIPALADFVAALTLDAQGELDDVSYEPSANTSRWAEYQVRADEMRRLRSVVAASSSLGVFRLDEEVHAAALLQGMRSARSFDPALAVYAAYAFNDRRMRDQIRDMQSYLQPDLGLRLFDVAMLALELGEQTRAGWPKDVYPCVPLLAQGWALLNPLGIRLPGRLDERGLRQYLRPSLWSHFDAGGVALLRQALTSGEVG